MTKRQIKKAGFMPVGKSTGYLVYSNASSETVVLAKALNAAGKRFEEYADVDGKILLVPIAGK